MSVGRLHFAEVELLAKGGFLELCRRHVVAGDLASLREHAEGRSLELRELVETYDLATPRLRAVPHLAIAMVPTLVSEQRATHLKSALDAWPLEADELDVGAVGSPEDVLAHVRQICMARVMSSRPGQLADLAALLAGKPLVVTRTARLTVPLMIDGEPVRRELRVELVAGGIPGVLEDARSMLGLRGATWRDAEKAAEAYAFNTLKQIESIRYSLWDRSLDEGASSTRGLELLAREGLDGASASLALTTAVRWLLSPRRRRLDPRAIVSGQADAAGHTRGVERLDSKLAGLPRRARVIVAASQEAAAKEIVPRARGVATVDAALTKALWRPPIAVWPAVAGVAIAIAVVASLAGRDRQQQHDREAAIRALPARVAAARHQTAHVAPDRGALLAAEEALVTPSSTTLRQLVEAHESVARRQITLRPQRGGVTAIANVPGTSQVLTGGESGVITLWDASTGGVLSTVELQKPFAVVHALVVSPDRRLVAAVGEAGTLFIGRLRARTLETVSEFTGLGNGITPIAAAFTRDSRRLWVGTHQGAGAVVEGPKFHNVSFEPLGTGPISQVVRISGPKALVCADSTTGPSHLYIAEPGGKPKSVMNGSRMVRCPAAALGAHRVLASTGAGRDFVVGDVRGDHFKTVRSGQFSEPIISVRPTDAVGRVAISGSSRVAVYTAHADIVGEGPSPSTANAQDISVRAKLVLRARSGVDAVIVPFDGRPSEPTRAIADNPSISSGLAVSPHGRLAVGLANGDVMVMRTLTSGAPQTIVTGLHQRVRSIVWDPSGRVLYAGDEGGYVARILLNSPDRSAILSDPLKGPIRDMDISPDGRSIVVAAFQPGGLAILSTRHLDEEARDSNVEGAAARWLTSRTLLVSKGAGARGSDTPRLEVVDRDFSAQGHTVDMSGPGIVRLIARPRSRTIFLAIGAETTLLTADARGVHMRHNVPTSPEGTSGAWSPDARAFAVVDETGELTYWDAVRMERLASRDIGGPIAGLTASNGQIVVTQTDPSSLRYLTVGVPAWAQDICRRTADYLTPLQWLQVATKFVPYRKLCSPPN